MASTLARIFLALAPAAALRNGLDLVPPMGWSNWESSGCDVSEDLIKRSADALIAKGLADVGYKIVGIDDCWAELNRNASGHLVPTANFSSGMKSLGDYLHKRGFKFGIYSSAGVHCCQHTMPGSLGYEWIDAQDFASWGVDFLKYDGCFMEEFHETLQDAPRRFPFTPPPILRYPIMQQALNKTGRNISYLCNFPWKFWDLFKDPSAGGDWVGEFCNSWRTGGDAQPGFFSALSYVDGSEKYTTAVPSRPGRWNHLDSLEIGNNVSFDASIIGGPARPADNGEGGMTQDQERAVFSLYALVKSPLFIGADVLTLKGHSLETYLNKEVIAVNQDPLGARGRLVRPHGGADGGEVWAVDLSGGEGCIVLMNRQQDQTQDIAVTWEEVGLAEKKNTEMNVRDLWLHRDLGSFSDGFTAKAVRPTSAVVLRVSPKVDMTSRRSWASKI